VLIQSSGFGNLLNPLTSLTMTFDIPVPIFMSLRGWPDPARDEPQHAVMGRTGMGLLDALGVPHLILEADEQHLAGVLKEFAGRTVFVLVPKGTITPAEAHSAAPPAFARREAIGALVPFLDGAVVFTTTGYISRELYGQADRPTHFYMQGSMGHALALGLGAALSAGDRRVIVVDGDGAVLMHLGTSVTVGALGPRNLLHIVLDNGAYESTGGQPTTTHRVDWLKFGAAAGYRTATICASRPALEGALRAIDGVDGPHLVVARIEAAPGLTPPRVTSGLTPVELRERFERMARR
jgi:phosphonopyruvate decarboxylase